MELDAQPGPGQGVPELVRQPGGELRQEPGPLRDPDGLLHLAEPGRHPLDRPGQVLDLVAGLSRVEVVEVARRDPGHLALESADPPADSVRDPGRDPGQGG